MSCQLRLRKLTRGKFQSRVRRFAQQQLQLLTVQHGREEVLLPIRTRLSRCGVLLLHVHWGGVPTATVGRHSINSHDNTAQDQIDRANARKQLDCYYSNGLPYHHRCTATTACVHLTGRHFQKVRQFSHE